MQLSHYADQIRAVAKQARTEAKLEVEVTSILRKCLGEFGIKFDPAVDETLKSLGLSQVNADRPDGVFGHIVYDFKEPNLLAGASALRAGKAQIERYLDSITGGGHAKESVACGQWFAYLLDGHSFAFCRSDGTQWAWNGPVPVSESSLLFLVHAYRSLKRKPLTAPLLGAAFGKDAPVARELIRVMCASGEATPQDKHAFPRMEAFV